MTLCGCEVHTYHRGGERHARVRVYAHIFEGMGHERRAYQRCSAHSRAAIRHNVQVVSHRTLRLQSRLAPDDDADACTPARNGAGRWENMPSVARWRREWAKKWGQPPHLPSDRPTSSVPLVGPSKAAKLKEILDLPCTRPLTGGAQCAAQGWFLGWRGCRLGLRSPGTRCGLVVVAPSTWHLPL